MKALIEGLTTADIKNLYNSGKKIHGLECYIELPAAQKSKLDEKVKKLEGFEIAGGHEITFKNYTRCKESFDKTKWLIQVGWQSDSWKGKDISNIKHTEFDAYVKKFGIANFKTADEINFADYEADNVIKKRNFRKNNLSQY